MKTWGWVSLAIGGLIVAAIVIVLVTPDTEQLDPSTPEGTVQLYVMALIDSDTDAASEYRAPEMCDEFHAEFHGDVRVELLDSSIEGDRAKVDIRVTYAQDGIFGGGYSEDYRITLESQAGSWLVVAESPMLTYCRGGF